MLNHASDKELRNEIEKRLGTSTFNHAIYLLWDLLDAYEWDHSLESDERHDILALLNFLDPD